MEEAEAAAGEEDAAAQQPSTPPPPDKPKDTQSETLVPAATDATAAPSLSASPDTDQPVPSLSNQDLQEIRSNLQEAAREASDLLRDVEY